MRVYICSLLLVPVIACASEEADPLSRASQDSLIEEVSSAAEGPHAKPSHPSEEHAFAQSLVGFWRTKNFQRGAWVDLIWVMGKQSAWHVVTAYGDEGMTVPLLRWDIVRSYRLEQRSASVPDSYDIVWTDRAGTLTAYVDNPGLFKPLGIDDCALRPQVPRDLSTDNCGAPLFPVRDCGLKDFVQLKGASMTFGDPLEGDRCLARPTRYEAWSFERVPLTPDLSTALTSKP